MDAFKLMRELKMNCEQEVHYLPKETGLSLLESTTQTGGQVSAACRDTRAEDLWSLTSFFGYSTRTFVLAISLLDRFLALMKVQPKHLSCVSLSCLHLAAKVTEQECDVCPVDELIRIGQCRFSVSDLQRMEAIVARKLHLQGPAVTALTFLQLYHRMALAHSSEWKDTLSLEKLEAQLKACLCRLAFSRAKPSVLALSILRLEAEAIQSEDLLEIAHHIQRHLKIADSELHHWGALVAQCLREYASPRCSRPDHRKLLWVVSRRTARTLHSCCRSAPELPTIPETWGAGSEASGEELSSGEESLSCSPRSNDGCYFPLDLHLPHSAP